MPFAAESPAGAVAAARRPAWVAALLDLVFPPFCPVCRALLGEGRRDPLCLGCWAALERIAGRVCRVCGRAMPEAIGAPPDPRARTCGPCRLEPPPFAFARAAAHYGETVRHAVHAFKFGGRRALAAPLGDLLAGIDRGALPVPGGTVVVPVPLHPARERERGFNQSALLAARLGRAWDLAVAPHALARTRPTAPQVDLEAAARRANVRGAFAVPRPARVADRDVLLVDDVLTTGATAAACARALHAAGARSVGVLTVARVS